MEEQVEAQRIPIKMYRSDDRLMVAAPMPGMEPDNLSMEVTSDGRLLLKGSLRGVLKGIKDLLVDEWSVGDYERDVRLPQSVNGLMANVTYGNGVLVVALPLADHTTPARLTVPSVSDAHGDRPGNMGHPIEQRQQEPHQDQQTRA